MIGTKSPVTHQAAEHRDRGPGDRGPDGEPYSATDTFHAHFSDHGSVVAVPVDGTGPTYTGNFWDLDSDNIRAVRHGDVLVQKDTDLMRAILHGSDGSRAFVMTHAQLTINANGGTTVQFEIDKIVCS